MIGAIILAAGESRRMGGRPKPLLQLGGETFLSLLVRTLQAAGVEEIRAVVHPDLRARGAELAGPGPKARAGTPAPPEPGERMEARPHSGLVLVFPPQPTPEPLASLLFGMGGGGGPPAVEDRWEAMLVQPVDHPLVRVDTVRRLIAIFREGGLQELAPAAPAGLVEARPPRFPLVLPIYRRRGGHPLLVAANLFGEVRRLDPGKEGLRGLLQADPARVLRLEVEDGGTVRGVNTPEDFARIRQPGSGLPIKPRPA